MLCPTHVPAPLPEPFARAAPITLGAPRTHALPHTRSVRAWSQPSRSLTLASPVLYPRRTTFTSNIKQGTVAGAYSLFGGLGILFCTYVGGLLFDSWTRAAPFLVGAIINVGICIVCVTSFVTWCRGARNSGGGGGGGSGESVDKLASKA